LFAKRFQEIALHALVGNDVFCGIIGGLLLSGVKLLGMIQSASQRHAYTLAVLLAGAPIDLEHPNMTINSFSMINESD